MAMKTISAGKHLRQGIALLLAVCMLIMLAPAGLAGSVGTSPSAVVDSSTMTFVKLSKAVDIFKENTKPSTGYLTVASGTWLMLASTDVYTITTTDTSVTPNVTTETQYGCIYYNYDGNNGAADKRYNVLWADISADVQATTAADAYVTTALWTNTNYASLKPEFALKRDVRVYSLQLALRTLGYYSSALDGSYGDMTVAAVKAFQKNYKLDVDGYAGPYTQKVLYPLAIAAYSSSGSTIGSQIGTLTTTAKVNLRKSYSTKTARLIVVPKKTALAYSKTVTTGGVTWYYVTYKDISGWLMGTYTSASGSSGGTETVLGSVTGNTNTVVRKTANGARTGYLLSKGSTAALIGAPLTGGGYSWYYVKLTNGVKGYVRGDLVTVVYDAGGGITPSVAKTYVKVSDAGLKLFTTEEAPADGTTGITTAPAGAILQLVSTEKYTKNSVDYASLYYQNKQYNVKYADISGIMMAASEVTKYITETVWPGGVAVAGSLKATDNLKGNIMVHSLQYALTVLGYYTGAQDGNYGSATTAAVTNFQKNNKTVDNKKMTVDGFCGPETGAVLYPKAIAALSGGGTSSDFGTVTKVIKANWNYGDNGGAMFPKSSIAKVMDMATRKVFTVIRWSGANHADCVPLTAADTKIMCDIVGFTYNSAHPTTAQLNSIIADPDNSTYTWPDFKGSWSGSSIGSAWDRRPAYLNINGTVYCVSIYGWPHGYSDIKNFSPSPLTTNYYGMMCLHFVGSKTHGGSVVDAGHQASINTAYSTASSIWPGKVQ